MKIWFIRHNNETLGPYTAIELKNLGITKDDFVWREGLADWAQVKAHPEIADLLVSSVPPPFVPAQSTASSHSSNYHSSNHYSYSNSEKVGYAIGRYWRMIGLVLVALIVGYIVYSKKESPGHGSPFAIEKTAAEQKADLADTERQNPTHYLDAKSSMRENLIGETVLKGFVKNNASIAAFKDVVLEVEFLSKTNTVITTKRFTVYEIITPGSVKEFKLKTFVSNSVKDFRFAIAGAVAAN